MASNREHDPGRQIENRLEEGIPGPQRLLLQPALRQIKAVLIDHRPDIADFDIDQMLVGDRLGAVIDEEEKSGRQQAKSEETQQKSDHGR